MLGLDVVSRGSEEYLSITIVPFAVPHLYDIYATLDDAVTLTSIVPPR